MGHRSRKLRRCTVGGIRVGVFSLASVVCPRLVVEPVWRLFWGGGDAFARSQAFCPPELAQEVLQAVREAKPPPLRRSPPR